MPAAVTIKTQQGEFRPDKSGLWHYHQSRFSDVFAASEDAVACHSNPSWFWFNGTCAPIFSSDTADSLRRRWSEWREAWQKDPRSLLSNLSTLHGGE